MAKHVRSPALLRPLTVAFLFVCSIAIWQQSLLLSEPLPAQLTPNADLVPYKRESNEAFVFINIGKAVRVDVDFSERNQYTNPDTTRIISMSHTYDPAADDSDEYPVPFLVNNDDDNNNGVIDLYELQASQFDDDLFPVEIGYWVREDVFMLDLEASINLYPQNAARLWQRRAEGFTEIIPNVTKFVVTDLPRQIYIEPVAPAQTVQLEVAVAQKSGQSVFNDRYGLGSASTDDRDMVTFTIEDAPVDPQLTTGEPVIGTTAVPRIPNMPSVDVLNFRTHAFRIPATDPDTPRSNLQFEIVNVIEIEGDENCQNCYLDCGGTTDICRTGDTCAASSGQTVKIDYTDFKSINFRDYDRVEGMCRACQGAECAIGCETCGNDECAFLSGNQCLLSEDRTVSELQPYCDNNSICEPELGETCGGCPSDCQGQPYACGPGQVCGIDYFKDKYDCVPCNLDGTCSGIEDCNCPDCQPVENPLGEEGPIDFAERLQLCSNPLETCQVIKPVNNTDLVQERFPVAVCRSCTTHINWQNQAVEFCDNECYDGSCNEVKSVANFEQYFHITPQAGTGSVDYGVFWFDQGLMDSPVSPLPTRGQRRFRVDVRVTDPEGNSDTNSFFLALHNYNWSVPNGAFGVRQDEDSEFGSLEPVDGGYPTFMLKFSSVTKELLRKKFSGYLSTHAYQYNPDTGQLDYQPDRVTVDRQSFAGNIMVRGVSGRAANADPQGFPFGGGGGGDKFKTDLSFDMVGRSYSNVFETMDRQVGGKFGVYGRSSFQKTYTTVGYDNNNFEFPRGEVGYAGLLEPVQDTGLGLAFYPPDGDENTDPPEQIIELDGPSAVEVTAEFDDECQCTVYTFDHPQYKIIRSATLGSASIGGQSVNATGLLEPFDDVRTASDPVPDFRLYYRQNEGVEGLDVISYRVKGIVGYVYDLEYFPKDKFESTGITECGNGFVEEGEKCDDGEANGTTESNCNDFCQRVQCNNDDACYNGICIQDECRALCNDDTDCWQPGTECRGNYCQDRCGNGVIDAGEQCDAGDENSRPGSGCNGSCQRTECVTEFDCLDIEQCIDGQCIGTDGNQSSSTVSEPASSTATTSSAEVSSAASSVSMSSAISSSSSSAPFYDPESYSCPLYPVQ